MVSLKAGKYTNTSRIMQQVLCENDIRNLNLKTLNLNELGKAQLMRRIDSKYILPAQWANEFVARLIEHYYIIENKTLRMPQYVSEYFDTENFSMYLAHHNKRPKRFKIRLRHYMASGDLFLEVKNRTCSGETVKKRVEVHDHKLDKNLAGMFIEKTVPYRFDELKKTLYTSFNRITLVSFDFNERVTLDFNISLKSTILERTVNLSDICIVESKRDKYSSSSFLVNLLKRNGLRETSFSKYSIGCALLYNHLKANNFKPIINQLNKYVNGNLLADTTS